MSETNLLEKVSAKFPATQVKKNPQGFDYVDIPSVIGRLNEVFGLGWSSHHVQTTCTIVNPETHGVGLARNEWVNGTKHKVQVTGFLYNVAIEITAGGSTRVGVGAGFSADPDNAYKTALAEAIKKAGHAFGIALYLWDEEERADVAQAQRAAGGSLSDLKLQVAKLAKEQGVKPDAEGKLDPTAIAAKFEVDVEDLKNVESLKLILTKHGKI